MYKPDRIHFLLPIFTILSFFGPGYQNISMLIIMWFTLSIYYFRNVNSSLWLLLYYLMNSIGCAFAFWGSYHSEEAPFSFITFIYTLVPLLLVNLVILISLSVDRWCEISFKDNKESNDVCDGGDDDDVNDDDESDTNDSNNNGLIRSLVFPCVWTCVWNLVIFTWPLGDYFNYAYVFLGNDEMMQFASFAGLGGLNFILSWVGSVSADLIEKYLENGFVVRIQKTSSPSPSMIIDDDINPNRHENLEDQQNHVAVRIVVTPPNKNKNDDKPFTFKPPKSLLVYLLILFVVFVYGSIRLSTSYIPFYQQNIAEFTPEKLTRVGCVIKGEGIFDDNRFYINRTIELAKNDNKMILWSEIAGLVTRQEELDDLITTIKNISITYSTTIGFTILDGIISDKSYNRLLVVTPSGDVAIDYRKSHLVPLPDPTLTKGDNRLQTFESNDFGVVGAAICIDYNFPNLIGQASKKNVDFMLNTCLNWGPSGIYQSRVNIIRTIENGFTMMKCSRYGISGVWNPYGQIYSVVPTLGNLTISFDFPLKKRVKTVYGVFGESFGWICLGLTIIIVSLLIFFKFFIQENFKRKIQKWL